MRLRLPGSWFYLLVSLGLLGPSRLLAAEEPRQPPPSQGTPNPPEGASVPAPGPSTAPVPETIPVPVPVPVPAPGQDGPRVPDTTVIIVTPPAPQPLPSFRIEGNDSSALRIGLLLQPQFQSAGSTNLDKYSNNLFLRRTRILLGGTLFGRFDYFVDTDYPNLFLPASSGTGATATYQKNTPGMNIQDAFGTWRVFRDMVKIDVGYMLPPLLHNAVQGATTLYSWDYFSYAFQSGTSFGSSGNPVGRDAGIQARGLLAEGHVEYRAGLFQGRRDAPTATETGSRNFFRFAARVQLNLLDAETGFFYQGTYLGARKILSVGGTVDLQDSYRMYGGDVFLDLPLGPIGVVTAQGDVAHWNGHGFIPTLVKQTAVMGEAGMMFSMLALGPIVRFEHLWLAGANNDQTRYVAGLAFWPFGHNSNVKAFYTRFQESGTPHGFNQFNVQWQLYFF